MVIKLDYIYVLNLSGVVQFYSRLLIVIKNVILTLIICFKI